MKTRRVAQSLAGLALLGAAAASACSSEETSSSQLATTDGGVVTQDGGVVHADGGVVYVDGGVVYVDGGPLYHDAGPYPLGPWDAGESTCADAAAAAEPLGEGIWGCAGRVRFANRAVLCGDNASPCDALRYEQARRATPTHSYWLADDLRMNGASSSACFGSITRGKSCTFTVPTPARICAGKTDPEGNTCSWTGCGYGGNTTSEWLGGGEGDFTAGTLCCPDAPGDTVQCTNEATASESFGAAKGCAGRVTWLRRSTLCAAGSHPCTAAQWVAVRSGASPAHDYWTDDDLAFSGGPDSCSVAPLGGIDGYAGRTNAEVPAHVCVSSKDPEGNLCAIVSCGLEIAQPSSWIGGWPDDAGVDAQAPDVHRNATAGTICCYTAPGIAK